MKVLPVILFISGLAIQFAALLGEHAAEIPFVIKRVAPSYYRAQEGIDTLQKKKKLEKTDVGFGEISGWSIGNMHEINGAPRNFASDFKVDSISCMGELRQEGTSHGDEVYLSDDIRCTLSTETNHLADFAGHLSRSMEWHFHILALKENVERLKEPGILRFCFGMFLVGSMVEVVGFMLEFRETKKAETAANKNHPSESAEKEDQKQPSI